VIAARKFDYLFVYIKRIPRQILKAAFRFDQWHVIGSGERKYVHDVIEFLNNLPEQERKRVVEIGCGLGDIIKRLHFVTKVGYDSERNVLKAARFLAAVTFNDTAFSDFVFPSTKLKDKSNAIVMVNWIHHVKSPLLKEYLELYFLENLLPNGCIIIDTVQAKNYKYNHDISYLTSTISCSVVKIGSYENQREVFAIFKS
jgi:SAM-dependent methyltransferase